LYAVIVEQGNQSSLPVSNVTNQARSFLKTSFFSFILTGALLIFIDCLIAHAGLYFLNPVPEGRTYQAIRVNSHNCENGILYIDHCRVRGDF
jgi:hypothetical protein